MELTAKPVGRHVTATESEEMVAAMRFEIVRFDGNVSAARRRVAALTNTSVRVIERITDQARDPEWDLGNPRRPVTWCFDLTLEGVA